MVKIKKIYLCYVLLTLHEYLLHFKFQNLIYFKLFHQRDNKNKYLEENS